MKRELTQNEVVDILKDALTTVRPAVEDGGYGDYQTTPGGPTYLQTIDRALKAAETGMLETEE